MPESKEVLEEEEEDKDNKVDKNKIHNDGGM